MSIVVHADFHFNECQRIEFDRLVLLLLQVIDFFDLKIGGEKLPNLELRLSLGLHKGQVAEVVQKYFGSQFLKSWFLKRTILVPIVVPNDKGWFCGNQ